MNILWWALLIWFAFDIVVRVLGGIILLWFRKPVPGSGVWAVLVDGLIVYLLAEKVL